MNNSPLLEFGAEGGDSRLGVIIRGVPSWSQGRRVERPTLSALNAGAPEVFFAAFQQLIEHLEDFRRLARS